MKWHQPPTDNKWQPHEIPNDECLEFCLDALTHRGNCIDVGGHIGTMTRKLAENFNYVYSFEPLWHEYLTKNTNDLKNVKIYNVGLGNEKTKEKIYIMPTNTGGSTIVEHKKRAKFQKQKWTQTKDIDIKRLDDYDFKNIDFIKIDVESYEYHVVKGAEKTLNKHRPLIMIELMKRYEDNSYPVQATQNLLEKEYGFKLLNIFGDDYVYS